MTRVRCVFGYLTVFLLTLGCVWVLTNGTGIWKVAVVLAAVGVGCVIAMNKIAP